MEQLDIRTKFSLTFYRLLYSFASMLVFGGIVFLQPFVNRLREGFFDYLGFVKRHDASGKSPLFWVHGVSMGESLVAFALISELKLRFPEAKILFTTTHPDVYKTAKKKRIAHLVAYFPLDSYVFMKRAFDRWRPTAVFVVETDFWPEFSWQCKTRAIPLFLINGRVSHKIETFYVKFKNFAKLVFGSYDCFCVQNHIDKARLEGLGVLAAHINVLGNIKADLLPESGTLDDNLIKWQNNEKTLVFGSVHPVEFAIIKDLLPTRKEKLVIAPRNIALAPKWHEELNNAGFKACLKSKLDMQANILILDSMGELFSLYSMADVAFIGGSIDKEVGGHNPLEIMQQKVPLICGPYHRNFADIIEKLTLANAVEIAADAIELNAAIDKILQDEEKANAMIERAYELLDKNRGALLKTLELIEPKLKVIKRTEANK